MERLDELLVKYNDGTLAPEEAEELIFLLESELKKARKELDVSRVFFFRLMLELVKEYSFTSDTKGDKTGN